MLPLGRPRRHGVDRGVDHLRAGRPVEAGPAVADAGERGIAGRSWLRVWQRQLAASGAGTVDAPATVEHDEVGAARQGARQGDPRALSARQGPAPSTIAGRCVRDEESPGGATRATRHVGFDALDDERIVAVAPTRSPSHRRTPGCGRRSQRRSRADQRSDWVGGPLRRPTPRRHAAALRPAPGDRRRAAVVGRPQGSVDGHGRAPPGRAGRRPRHGRRRVRGRPRRRDAGDRRRDHLGRGHRRDHQGRARPRVVHARRPQVGRPVRAHPHRGPPVDPRQGGRRRVPPGVRHRRRRRRPACAAAGRGRRSPPPAAGDRGARVASIEIGARPEPCRDGPRPDGQGATAWAVSHAVARSATAAVWPTRKWSAPATGSTCGRASRRRSASTTAGGRVLVEGRHEQRASGAAGGVPHGHHGQRGSDDDQRGQAGVRRRRARRPRRTSSRRGTAVGRAARPASASRAAATSSRSSDEVAAVGAGARAEVEAQRRDARRRQGPEQRGDDRVVPVAAEPGVRMAAARRRRSGRRRRRDRRRGRRRRRWSGPRKRQWGPRGRTVLSRRGQHRPTTSCPSRC